MKTALYVLDEKARDDVCGLLDKMGLDVTYCSYWECTAEYLLEREIALIIMDITMLDDGWLRLAKVMAGGGITSPVIVILDPALSYLHEILCESGVEIILQPPIKLAQLARIVGGFIRDQLTEERHLDADLQSAGLRRHRRKASTAKTDAKGPTP